MPPSSPAPASPARPVSQSPSTPARASPLRRKRASAWNPPPPPNHHQPVPPSQPPSQHPPVLPPASRPKMPCISALSQTRKNMTGEIPWRGALPTAHCNCNATAARCKRSSSHTTCTTTTATAGGWPAGLPRLRGSQFWRKILQTETRDFESLPPPPLLPKPKSRLRRPCASFGAVVWFPPSTPSLQLPCPGLDLQHLPLQTELATLQGPLLKPPARGRGEGSHPGREGKGRQGKQQKQQQPQIAWYPRVRPPTQQQARLRPGRDRKRINKSTRGLVRRACARGGGGVLACV